MKPHLLIILIGTSLLASCYPTTKFYVTNGTQKPISFMVTNYNPLNKINQTRTFHLDSDSRVRIRKVGVSKKRPLEGAFLDISFNATDSIRRDPMNLDNWIKTSDKIGRPVYEFYAKK